MLTETAKFTPGPWEWNQTPESSNQEAVIESHYGGRLNSVASIDFQNLDGAAEANARLIAAAPELLELLEECYVQLECFDGAGHRDGSCLDQRVATAIKKAKGE